LRRIFFRPFRRLSSPYDYRSTSVRAFDSSTAGGLALLHHMTYECADQAFADADLACALAF
jgi:hypothetical protein